MTDAAGYFLTATDYSGPIGRSEPIQATETLERNAIIQKNLIDDLLDVSRIINGKFPMLKEPTDFGSIIRNTCQALKPLALQKEIELECDISLDRVQVSKDPTKLTQVVTNFVQNAVKFTSEGEKVKASLQVHGDFARFELQDSGIGIDPTFLPNVFDHLKQEDMGTTRSHSGLGLGLVICKHIVEGHVGKIAA
ncbi:MAG: HAMP domain-containing histidine kinase, partial [Bdellovibrionaceae bacterium]|nr:HAMP domain-containing histidine kinase [Pseudobdellovibrionaceae bacterium]